MQIPLFPLNTVLFPGGPLPLRIFETRYIDMISRCSGEGSSFGVVLINDGPEAGGPASTYAVGTLARIVDFYQGSDGLLGVTARGTQRFRLLQTTRQADGLNLGEVELIPDEKPRALPEADQSMARVLDTLLDDLGKLYADQERHLDDAGWVANRFLEILPIPLNQKQACLESSGIEERLAIVRGVLKNVTLMRSQVDDES